MKEATDRNAVTHLFPAVFVHEVADDGFESDAVEWIAGMFGHAQDKCRKACEGMGVEKRQ